MVWSSNKAYRYVIFSLLFLSAFTVNAINLTIKSQPKQLTAVITDINYPQSMLKKELNSGLQSHISVYINFTQNEKNLLTCHQSFQITYDLWDEHYVVTIEKNSDIQQTKIIKNAAEILLLLNTINVSCDEVLSKLSNNQKYLLQAKVLINPVNVKRIKKIKNWIATSKGHTADSDKVDDFSTTVNKAPVQMANLNNGLNIKPTDFDSGASARPRFEKLFEQILQQYSGPNNVASLWSSKVATKLLHLESVNDEY